MRTVTSKDGPTIAFDQPGKGPALILVGGMFEQRAMDSETAQLAALPLLAQHFTVFHYDRRGRGRCGGDCSRVGGVLHFQRSYQVAGRDVAPPTAIITDQSHRIY